MDKNNDKYPTYWDLPLPDDSPLVTGELELVEINDDYPHIMDIDELRYKKEQFRHLVLSLVRRLRGGFP